MRALRGDGQRQVLLVLLRSLRDDVLAPRELANLQFNDIMRAPRAGGGLSDASYLTQLVIDESC